MSPPRKPLTSTFAPEHAPEPRLAAERQLACDDAIGDLVWPGLSARKGILVLRHARPTHLIGVSGLGTGRASVSEPWEQTSLVVASLTERLSR